MRICLVHARPLVPGLRAAGHEVLDLQPPAGLADLPRLLAEAGWKLGSPTAPQGLLQCERLGPRTLLAGLELLGGPALFWSVDTHLNLFWHSAYARCFDLVLTTQPELAAPFEAAGTPGRWLPWFGPRLEFTPHANRERDLGFVGRITKERPGRVWFHEHLAAHGAAFQEGLSPSAMHRWYAATRAVPNEAILGEINFRVFEAAGAGCALLTPHTGPGQDTLLASGRECLVYEDVLELDELLDWLARRPDASEAMGRRAWQRVQSEHLAEHRAASVAALLEEFLPGRRDAARTRQGLVLAMLRLWLAGRWELPPGQPLELCGLLDQEEGRVCRLEVLARQGDEAGLRRELDGVLELAELEFPLALAAGFAALKLDDPAAAGRCWSAWVDRPESPVPSELREFSEAWSGACEGHGLLVRPGFPFDPARHLPACAAECLVAGLKKLGDDIGLMARLERVLARVKGGELDRLGLASRLSLLEPKVWRWEALTGLLNLRLYRRGHGLEELAVARQLAAAQGMTEAFARVVAAEGPGRATRVNATLEILYGS